jgi:hypothetical protein
MLMSLAVPLMLLSAWMSTPAALMLLLALRVMLLPLSVELTGAGGISLTANDKHSNDKHSNDKHSNDKHADNNLTNQSDNNPANQSKPISASSLA